MTTSNLRIGDKVLIGYAHSKYEAKLRWWDMLLPQTLWLPISCIIERID